MLEFIASVTFIWVDINNKHNQPYECILSQTDSTSAAGWLKKSNFNTVSTSKSSAMYLAGMPVSKIKLTGC